jgi:hypothetical protein
MDYIALFVHTPEALKLAERRHRQPVNSRTAGRARFRPDRRACDKCQRSESDIGLQRFRIQSAIIESAGASWQN